MTPASRNPFRADRLDALVFRPHEPGLDAAEVVDRFRRARWRGAVVGPHGSGKSTLLRTLADAAEDEARAQAQGQGRDGAQAVWRCFVNRQTPASQRPKGPPPGAKVWAIDGWCHLSPPRRWALRRAAHRSGAGILGTAHLCGWGLPVRHRTRATPELLRDLLAELSPGAAADPAALLERTGGDIRAALFLRYDEVAGREPGPPAAVLQRLREGFSRRNRAR